MGPARVASEASVNDLKDCANFPFWLASLNGVWPNAMEEL